MPKLGFSWRGISWRGRPAGARARDARRARDRRELRDSSDRTLADLGLGRGDIDAVVDGSYRRG